MNTVVISPGELESGQISEEHLKTAAEAMRVDGYVVLKDVVNTDHLDIIRKKMLEDLGPILAREDAPFNFIAGNVQQDPPPFPPYIFRDVLVNDMVIAVTKKILGRGMKNAFYSGNTNLPGSDAQPVHTDSGNLWENLEYPHPAYAIVVNIPVVPMNEVNGSPEIWPGTHLDKTMHIHMDEIKIPLDLLEERRKTNPPIQPKVELGSVLIRDMRLWHRGMKNHSDQPRPMIALIHHPGWWAMGGNIPFAKGTEDILSHPDLHTNAIYVDGTIDYLHHGAAYDYHK